MKGWFRLRGGIALLLALVLVILVAPAAHALEPTDSFYVNDYVGVLSSRDAEYLAQRGASLRAENGVQIVVVIVDNYIGDSFEKYVNQIYNDFGIGSKEYNAGALLFIAMDSGDVRIEVGDGLSGQISDSKAGQILDRYFMPDAEAGDVAAGVYKTYLQLIQEGSRLDNPGEDPGGIGDTASLIVGIIGILLMIGALVGIIVLIRRAARRQPPGPPYGGGQSQSYPYGRTSGMPSQPVQGPPTRPNTGGPFYPYGGAPDYRLPRRVFFPFGGGTTTYPSGQGSSGNQDNQPEQQRPRSSGGGGKSAGGGTSRSFPATPARRSSGSSGRSSTPRSTPRSPFSGSSRPGGLFGGGGRSIGGGGRSFGGGASRGFKR